MAVELTFEILYQATKEGTAEKQTRHTQIIAISFCR